MKRVLSFLIVVSIPTLLYSGNIIHLAGTVSDLALKPVKSTIISLVKAGLSDTTDENGIFKIFDIVSPVNTYWKKEQKAPQIKGSQLVFSVLSTSQPVSLEVYNPKGAKVGTMLNSVLSEGEYSVSLHDYNLRNLSSSVFILVLKRGNNISRVQMINLNNRGFSISSIHNVNNSSPSLTVSKIDMRFLIVDTLVVTKDGVEPFRMALSTYTDTLISIILNIIPDVYIDKIDSFPDYYQMDTDYGGFPNGGSVYCGPTTVSNSIVWLSDHGYPDLATPTSDRKKDQYDVISLFGSSEYMDCVSGVGPDRTCTAVKKYINDFGYEYDSLLCQGWRTVESEFQTSVEAPVLDWVKGGILRNNVVWLNIGWYTYNSSSDEYSRNGGHWMTVVGYGHDSQSPDPNCFVVHDPGTKTTFNDYRVLEKITSGQLTGSNSGLPHSAIGYYKYSAGSNTYGILDAAVLLGMK